MSMNRGEVWILDLNPRNGTNEMDKIRPVVIVNDDSMGILPLKVIVPLTSWQSSFSGNPWLVKITKNNTNKLSNDSAADTFQIRSVDKSRFKNRIGRLNNNQMQRIEDALILVLKL